MPVKDLPKELGDPQSIRRDFRQVAADEKYLNARWDALLKTHRDEWVAVYRQEMIFAKNLRDLFHQAVSKKWDLGTIVVDCLAAERHRVLLETW